MLKSMPFIIDILNFEKGIFRIVGETKMGKPLLKKSTSFCMMSNSFNNFFYSNSLSIGGMCSRKGSVIIMTSIT